jgi:hypothetical protein
MKITNDVRQYAVESGYGVEEQDPIQTDGMEEVSKTSKELENGEKVCENTVNPLAGIVINNAA